MTTTRHPSLGEPAARPSPRSQLPRSSAEALWNESHGTVAVAADTRPTTRSLEIG
jgi:hypothetical protein